MVKYTACICEGGAERVILDMLLEHDKLIFARSELLEEEFLESRKGKDLKKRNKMSPSEYCKSILGMKHVKSVSFVKAYFTEISVLENSLYEYKRVSNVKKMKRLFVIC